MYAFMVYRPVFLFRLTEVFSRRYKKNFFVLNSSIFVLALQHWCSSFKAADLQSHFPGFF